MNDDWIETTLGEVASLTIGRTPPRKDPRYWTDDVALPFCTIADMNGWHLYPKREGITPLAVAEGRAKRVPAGSLLMSFKLTIGRIGFAGRDLFPNEAIVWIEPFSAEVDVRYLAYSLDAQDLSAGSGRAVKGNTLNSESLRAIPVELPPLKVQRRIVDLMEHLDAHLANLQTERDAATAHMRLLRNAAFADIGTIPAHRVFDIRMGRQRSPSRASGPHMTPYLRAANVKEGYLDFTDVKEMDFDNREQSDFGIRTGDVMVSEGSGSPDAVGACAQVGMLPSPVVCFQNTLLRYRAIEGVSRSGYVHHWCRWAYESGAFRDVATGTNILHIGARRAAEMLVPNLSLSEQDRVVEDLDSWQAVVRNLGIEWDRGRLVRKAVLSALLGKDLEVPGSYDELLGVV